MLVKAYNLPAILHRQIFDDLGGCATHRAIVDGDEHLFESEVFLDAMKQINPFPDIPCNTAALSEGIFIFR